GGDLFHLRHPADAAPPCRRGADRGRRADRLLLETRMTPHLISANLVSLLGIVAGCCTTISYVPQLARTWRTRSTHDISMPMFLLLVLGNSLWLVYGLLIGDLPLIAANAISVAFTSSIL